MILKSAKLFLDAIIFVKTSYPILLGVIFSVVDATWKPGIKARDHEQVKAGTRTGMSFVYKVPGIFSLSIDSQIQ